MEPYPGVFVSNVRTEEWEPDPEVPGSEMHELVHADGVWAGLTRFTSVDGPSPWTPSQRETIHVLQGEVAIEIAGGPTLMLNRNRCILCTRCVRFMDDVAHDPVLNVSERGDRALIGKFEGKDLTHPWAANVVDLCPVGSLLSKDFLHKARAWDLDKSSPILGYDAAQYAVALPIPPSPTTANVAAATQTTASVPRLFAITATRRAGKLRGF